MSACASRGSNERSSPNGNPAPSTDRVKTAALPSSATARTNSGDTNGMSHERKTRRDARLR